MLRFIKHIFITNLQSIPPLLKHIFVTFLPRREKQINSLTDRSKAVVPVLVLLFVALWFILRGDLLCKNISVCHFVLVFFGPFSSTPWTFHLPFFFLLVSVGDTDK